MASSLQSFIFFFFFFFLLVIVFVCNCMTFAEAANSVPAMYVFGDSLVDVGNNNHVNFPAAKANFYPNGIDFPTGKPTGRFCNGKNAADFLGAAEKVGLAAAPPYLSGIHNFTKTAAFNTGINFAFGGAGIIPHSSQSHQIFELGTQVDSYASVYNALEKDVGGKEAKARASKSLFLIEIGSNDIFGYFGSSHLRKTYTPPQFLDFISLQFENQLKRLYENGARKLVVIGVGAIGCTPAIRLLNITGGCNSELNRWASVYNQHLLSLLNRLKVELSGFHYSYFDGLSIMLRSIQKPSSLGFREVRAACCGGGRLKAESACIPRASYCSNREKYLFWDRYHPTEQAHHIFADLIFNGPKKYTFPLNLQTLIAI